MRRQELDTQEYTSNKGEQKMKDKKGRYAAMTAIGMVLLSGAFYAGSIAGDLYGSTQAVASEEISLPTMANLNEEKTEETFAETSNEFLENAQGVVGLPDVSDVVEQCMPSVVSITNIIEVTQTSNFFWYGQNNQQTQTQEEEAYGSGVIIGQNESELLIVTNNHVAVYNTSGESSFYQYTGLTKGLKVTFSDGTEHDAYLKGADEEADLAVIAVKLDDMSEETKAAIKVATVGDSDAAKVGQGVIAIGNALGLGQTTTIGYISALNREVTSEDGYTRTLMQVDAAINGGNSGGGLFNGKGELVGINSAKYKGVGIEGIGYAIPITSASSIIDDLKVQTTKVSLEEEERGYLGIRGEDVNTNWVSAYGYPQGAQIIQITENSPAEASGLQRNDIITAVNGNKVTSYTALRTELSYYAPGETVELTIQRIEGNRFVEMTVSVVLSSRDSIVTVQE